MAESRDPTVLVAEAMGRGKKNLVTENYSEAAEEFSSVCEMLSELHGPSGDQLAEAYFLYGKALLGCAREEAKLLDITETAPTEDSESEVESKADVKKNDESVVSSSTDEKDVPSSNSSDEKGSNTLETVPESAEKSESTETTENPSEKKSEDENVEENATNDDDDDEESEGDVATLQLAWEVLEISSQILSKKEDNDSKLLLAEVFSELGEVSLESSNFETASKDFERSLEIYEKLEKPMPREIAEAHFKIGLSHALMNLFEEAVQDFTKAVEILDQLIKDTPQEDNTLIKELNQTKEEILLKITDVKESKEQSIEAIRDQLNKVWPKTSSLGSATTNGAGSSSAVNGTASDLLTSPSNKPAVDISHLVKRKRKTDQEEEASCPKKPTP